jgi:hypothetical protein
MRYSVNTHIYYNELCNWHTFLCTCVQVLGKLNVQMQTGHGKRPKGQQIKNTECLIQAFASEDIAAGAELLTCYGENFWCT